ncbi:Uncharacterised protein [Klebsiella pneumoniae]|uniref:Uncharacterized protein n=1 Tax=Klebsiella pneumoniae TaxID=573 RepID=A0A9Q9PF89_KLEPN|nr:hypothetical protein AE87_02891 [Klebsiella pneumoniae CHS 31]CZQ42630.1 hypothetical protein RH201207_00004 [Klebsiella pneumoniae]CZQ45933.1 hypothetical protein RH201207_03561 [Klebsiella pneumoniae]CZQ47684.1 hypothetical protein RH201207_05360 [Klebsiella pneumoniae]SBW66562.1 Uncharacterised protein [Klebsiella pneumoniae]
MMHLMHGIKNYVLFWHIMENVHPTKWHGMNFMSKDYLCKMQRIKDLVK